MKEAIQKYREVRHKWEELESLSEAPGSSFMRKINEDIKKATKIVSKFDIFQFQTTLKMFQLS